MKKIVLINTPNLPCPGSHYLHTRKFLDGFKHYEYEYAEVNDIQQIEQYPNSSDIIFYVSNHGSDRNEIEILSKFTNSTFVLWFWHNELSMIKGKLNKWILTGEHFRRRPLAASHTGYYDLQLTLDNYVPLTFAANIHPDDLQENDNQKLHDCFYVGHFYNLNWRGPIMEKFPNSFLRYTPPFISEEERVSAFSSSFASLGFQHPTNKHNFVITERIFEAMMYGCLVLVDSEFITSEIPEVAIYVESPDDIIRSITYYKQHPDEARVRIKNGYDYLRKCGTYYHTCGNFINKMENLGYI